MHTEHGHSSGEPYGMSRPSVSPHQVTFVIIAHILASVQLQLTPQ